MFSHPNDVAALVAAQYVLSDRNTIGK
jgi:hypothetical protein